MCPSSVFNTNAHIAARNINDPGLPFLADATFDFKGSTFSHVVLIDSGATHTIIPERLLPAGYETLLDKSKLQIMGVGTTIATVGQVMAKVQFGNYYFTDIMCLVVKSDCPILIGRNVVKHHSIQKTVYYHDRIVFHRKLVKAEFEHVVPLHAHRRALFAAPNSDVPGFVAGNAHPRCILQPTNTPHAPEPVASNADERCILQLPLKEKVQWIKHNVFVSLDEDIGDQSELEKVANLIIKYQEAFGTEKSPLGKFPKQVGIPTTGEARYSKQHTIPQRYEGVIDREVAKMLAKGVIEPCRNPRGFNTPIFIVDKKNGDPRVVANFKNSLNKVLSSGADMAWQMPSADAAFNKIGLGNEWFSSLDLSSAYWLCEIKEEDRYKTAFQWANRCYQYTRLPFGLACSGNIFSRCIAEALEKVANTNNFHSYVDDVLCFGKTFEEYLSTLEQIFNAVLQAGIRFNAKKCTFVQKSAKFLGRIVSKTGYKADPEYTQAIRDMPPPTSRTELRSLIGRILWLRMFVETRVGERVRNCNFAHLLSEINKLNRQDKKFEWTESAQKSLDLIKTRLTTMPVMSFPDFQKDFIVVTDASEVACGCVVMQEHDGNQVIVAAASSTFSATEQKWSATEREAYGILWSLEKFQYLLKGRSFVVLTDHKSLCYIDETEFKNAKICRWQDRLSNFRFVVQYIEGEKNVFADMLSRPFGISKSKCKANSQVAGSFKNLGNSDLRIYVPSWCRNTNIESEVSLLATTQDVLSAHCFTAPALYPKLAKIVETDMPIRKKQLEDPFLEKVIDSLRKESTGNGKGLKIDIDDSDHRGYIFKRFSERFFLDPFTDILMVAYNDHERFVVPSNMLQKLLYMAHNQNGHFGRERVKDFLDDYWWPFKLEDISNYVNSCVVCCKRKGVNNRSAKPPLGHLLRGTKPFEMLYIDFVHMPSSNCGRKYILTILDSFSRYLIAVPTTRDRAVDAANAILREVIFRTGFTPKIISSDRGTHFTGEVFKEMCRSFHIEQKLHCSWHPESSGNVERCHRTLKNAIYAITNERNCDWMGVLPQCVHAMNISKNAATGVSPHFVVYGRKPEIGLPVVHQPCGFSFSNPKTYGANLRTFLGRVHHLVQVSAEAADKSLDATQNSWKKVQKIVVGDMVYVERKQSAVAKATKMPWVGPYKVAACNDYVVKITDEKGNSDWIHRHLTLKHVARKPELSDPDLDFLLEAPNLADASMYPQHVPAALSENKSRGDTSTPKIPAPKVQQSTVLRRSSRKSVVPERLRIDPKQKSYAACLY